MPNEDIERTIYKLELDPSAYIAGVDKAAASTDKLSIAQQNANKTLEDNKKALAAQSDYLAQTKRDLDSYTGTNERYRQQLTKSFQSAQTDNQKLTDIVNKSKAAYDQAQTSAQNYANTAARASNLQSGTTGGKIPTTISASVPAQISSQIAGAINVTDFTQQAAVIQQTKGEFDDLRVSIGLAEARMKQLNETDDEFKVLAPIVAEGKNALEQYDNAAKIAGNSTERLRTQILLGRDALAGLEIAGKQNTAEYKDMQTHVALLTKEYHIAEEEIRVLSSQTRAFDFGKAGVQAAINGFQVYTAVSILAGGASEELQKKTLQLFAAMQLLSALEQLATSVKKGSIIYTNLQSAAQAVYTAVVGASTGALKEFKTALLLTGVGAALVVIGYLIEKYLENKEAAEKAAEATKVFKDINIAAAKSVADGVGKLEVFRLKLNDLTISQKDRVKFAKEYNEVADKTNQLDLKQLSNLTLINEQIDKENKLIIARAVSVAALAELNKVSDTFVESQLNLTTALQDAGTTEESLAAKQKAAAESQDAARKKQITSLDGYTSDLQKNANYQKAIGVQTTVLLTKQEKELLTLIQQRNNAKQALEDLARKLSPLITDIGTVKPDTDRAKKEIQDDFEIRKATLLAELAKLSETQFQSEVTLRKEYDAKLVKALEELDKDKGLKPGERLILVKLTTELNTSEFNKAIDDLRKKIRDAEQKLNEELLTLQNKANEDTLNLIQDEFDRRSKLIEFNQIKDLADAKENTAKSLQTLEDEKKIGLITEQDYQKAKAIIIATGEQNANNIIQKAANEKQVLSQDIFKSLLQSYEDAISAADLIRDEDQAKDVKKLNDKFLKGKINYDNYKKGIEKIKEKYDAIDTEGTLRVDKDELQALDEKLAKEIDKYSEYYKNLKAQRDKLADDIAKKEQTPLPDPKKTRQVSTIEDYASAIGDVAASVIQFWQAANDAESKALDRSIALQETRVAAAQRIADRGNAQYLKAEEDRLTQLNIARENAARRQLGIDAALQGSQILVGITGAIAKIATPGIGVAETIAEIAIIIGALATGYGLVKSLQSNQPKLAKGDPYVSRGNHPMGVDTIPAWLNEGEAVTSAEKNKEYHPTVLAIHKGSVPAKHLNDFVNNYHRIKSVPQIDHAKMKEVAELKINSDGKMSVLLHEHSELLKENNELQKQILKKKGVHVEQHLDKNGVAQMVTEFMIQAEINKKI